MKLLDDHELYLMTGYKRMAEQARWFRDHGYYVECNARGRPLITQEQVNERRRANTTPSANDVPQSEPNVLEFRRKLNLRT